MNRGIVYIMWNELFPELVKIGITSGSTSADVERRRKELSCGENMPQPFEAKFAICVNNYEQIERLIHKGLAKLRHNPQREFFRMSVEEAICTLTGYITSGSAVEVPIKNAFQPAEKKALEKTQKQRATITFKSLNIPVGAILNFVGDERLTVKVNNDSRRVLMPNGKQTTLTLAAKALRDKTNPGNDIKGLPDGAKDFQYRGKTLWQMWLEKQRMDIEG